MDCGTAQEAISATLDGEQAEVTLTDLEAHLAGCPACARWRARATELGRRSRLAGVDPVADLADVVLADVTLPSPRARVNLVTCARILLAVLAVVQVAIGLAQFLSPTAGHSMHDVGSGMFDHVGRETAAFNLAVGVGLLWISLHPRRAIDHLPFLGTLVILLTLLSAFDLGTGNVGWTRLGTHVPIVLATLVVLVLHWRQPGPVDPGAGRISGEVAEEGNEPPAAAVA